MSEIRQKAKLIQWIRSCLRLPKKLSATALSKQSPVRLMLPINTATGIMNMSGFIAFIPTYRAKAFYENTFQVTLERLGSPDNVDIELWAFPMDMDIPGSSGAIVKMNGKDSGTGGTIIYFSCADCAVEATRALQHGGQIQQEKMSIGEYGFIALVFDTEGNMIGLHSMK